MEQEKGLVTTKAGSVISENLKQSLATASGGLTPSTITAMVGISQGTALSISPDAAGVLNKLKTNDAFSNVANPLHTAVKAAVNNMEAVQAKLGMGSTKNLGAFGAFVGQIQGHINDSIELKNATNFVSNTNFSDFGTGITNMSSMVDQGLSSTFGSLSSAGNAVAGTGKLFDVKDMANFGSPVGLINQMRANKLGNSTGINKILTEAGVNLDRLDDPNYRETIDKVMSSVKDPTIINQIKEQFEVSPVGNIESLADFTNVQKLLPASSLTGLTGGLESIGKKFADMGGSFKDPAAAKNLLGNLSKPSIPNLDSAASSLNGLMSGMSSTINNMIGSGLTSSPNGVPNMADFLQLVGGSAEMTGLANSDNISAIASSITSMATKANSLITGAGVSTDTPAPPSLGSAMSFATGLHKFGADNSGSGVTNILSKMATSGSQFGDSIKASLAEGKNKALLAASGMKPIDFSGVPAGEAINNLKEGKFIPGTGSMTPQQINAIFGGGTSI